MTTRLTNAERRVAALAAGGSSNAEIATQLGVARKTVEAHLWRAFRKLGVASRADLAQLDAATLRPTGPLTPDAARNRSLDP